MNLVGKIITNVSNICLLFQKEISMKGFILKWGQRYFDCTSYLSHHFKMYRK